MEKSKSGARIYTHENLKKEVDFDTSNNLNVTDEITNHVEKHIGRIDSVFHEIISDKIHLDILIVKPTKKIHFGHSLHVV